MLSLLRYGFLVGFFAAVSFADGVACSDDYRNSLFISGSHTEMLVSDSSGYLIYERGGLDVFDMSNPKDPVLIGELDLPYGSGGAYLDESILYIANGTDGLLVVDVSIPASPELVGSLSETGSSTDVVVVHDLAYVAGLDGFSIVDISNPESPALLSAVVPDLRPYMIKVSVSDGHAYFVSPGNRENIQIFDVQDPLSPEYVGGLEHFRYIEDIIVDDKSMYLSSSRGIDIRIFDVSEPASPELIFESDYQFAAAYGMELVGDVLYVSEAIRGVLQFEVRDPFNPRDLGALKTHLVPSSVAVDGGIVYASVSGNGSGTRVGFESFHLDGLFAPSMQNRISLEGGGGPMSISGGVLYLDDGGVLRIFDMRDPLNPRRIAAHAGLSYWPVGVRQIEVVDGVGYVLGEDGVLRIMDLRNPLAPVLLGEFGIDQGEIHEFVCSDQILYLACGAAGMKGLDVSNPESPIVVGEFDSAGPVMVLALEDELVCVAVDGDGLRLVDVRDSSQPVVVGFQGMSQGVVDIEIKNQFAFVVKESVISGETSFRIFDISEPTSPSLLFYYTDPTIEMRSVSVRGRYAYIENGASGIVVFDVLDPYFSELVGVLRRSERGAQFVAIDDQVMFLTNDDLSVFDVSENFGCSDCGVDFNGNTIADFQDVSAYLEYFADNESFADLNYDGRWDFFDLSIFISAFEEGCP